MSKTNPLLKLESPSADRNKRPIWDVIESNIDLAGYREDAQPLRVLEIAAGSGIHTIFLASKIRTICSQIVWYPADMDDQYRHSIRAYATERSNLASFIQDPLPLTLDETGIQEASTKSILGDLSFRLILNINMIHISPWSATQGLMREAAGLLAKDGTLLLYGPYKVKGECCASNQSFDASLRTRNPEWGIRDMEGVVELAEANGLELRQTIEMPANNLSLLFQKKK